MRNAAVVIVVCLGSLLLVSCGPGGSARDEMTGIDGVVRLGPQCPVVQANTACDDQPAADVAVMVTTGSAAGAPGAEDVVAQTTTNTDGSYRIAVPPGDYWVTSDAGMSCEPASSHVADGRITSIDVSCDTGIR